MDSNHRPHAYQACALTSWAIDPCGGGKGIRTLDPLRARQVLSQLSYTPTILLNNLMIAQNWTEIKTISFEYEVNILLLHFSIERRWSSRRFSYGYLVTTSPQSLTLPSAAASLRLAHGLRVLPTLMVWRAVCTRPGNVFTATFWFAITSNSSFM